LKREDHGTVEVSAIIETLTGCPPEDVARCCDIDDLRAARLLLDEALDIQLSGPRLYVVPRTGTG
jgi:hypothetical protein